MRGRVNASDAVDHNESPGRRRITGAEHASRSRGRTLRRGRLPGVGAGKVRVAALGSGVGGDETELDRRRLPQDALELVEHRAANAVEAHRDDKRIDPRARFHGVAGQKEWRPIDDDEVALLPRLLDDRAERVPDDPRQIRSPVVGGDHPKRSGRTIRTVRALHGERGERRRYPDVDGLERLVDGDLAGCQLRQPGRLVEAEEVMDRGIPKVEVDENDTLTRARERDGEVRGGRRLAFLLESARQHDRFRTMLEVDQIDVRHEHADRLGVSAMRIGDGYETWRTAGRPRGPGQPPEKGHAESV